MVDHVPVGTEFDSITAMSPVRRMAFWTQIA